MAATNHLVYPCSLRQCAFFVYVFVIGMVYCLPATVLADGFVPIAKIQSAAVTESSGLIKSRQHEGIFWTHNDSGNANIIYAMRLTGEVIAEVTIEGAFNLDWEDIAIDDEHRLYIGDIGDNWGRIPLHTIYVIAEPDPFAGATQRVALERIINYRYEGERVDSEALFIHRGDMYVISKVIPKKRITTIYRLESAEIQPPQPQESTGTAASSYSYVAKPICTLELWNVTAADISEDGKRLAICCYGKLLEYDVPEDLKTLPSLKPRVVLWPWTNKPTEGGCYDGDDVILSSEFRELYRIPRKHIDVQHNYRKPNPR